MIMTKERKAELFDTLFDYIVESIDDDEVRIDTLFDLGLTPREIDKYCGCFTEYYDEDYPEDDEGFESIERKAELFHTLFNYIAESINDGDEATEVLFGLDMTTNEIDQCSGGFDDEDFDYDDEDEGEDV